jgi:CelD/BcsL family acetyltransferase involved in cellulose biosynthesis
MHVEVARASELGPDEAELWSRFQQRSEVTLNPFLSLTFAQVVDRARPHARVAVIEDAGHIQAFLAYELATKTIARPIGWPMNDLQGFVSSGTPLDARSIVRMAGLRGWRFEHVPVEQDALVRFHYAGTSIRCQEIDVSHGYDSYCKGKARSAARRTGQKRRALERLLGPLSVAWSDTSSRHLQQLMAWKSFKYHGASRLFSDSTAQQIVEELAFTVSNDCSGVLSVLQAGERPLAFHFGLAQSTSLHSWFPTYDPELAAYSPGMVMWFALAREAADMGITRIDLGYGQDRYKSQIAVPSYGVAGGAVWATGIETAARALYRRVLTTRPLRRFAGLVTCP